ncbi:hypothetical protein [Marinobacterium sp. BA1]|uniref:hypothetical protein n=1 Tax=Marinobacterium sp. BA1 TaxID=3138931 RepID=UPI0032E561EB
MKRTLTAVALTALMLTPAAQASDIRVDNGRDIIRAGDPASKLSRYLGRPNYSDVAKVCTKPSRSECRDSNSRWGRIYQYYYDDLNYQIEVYDGKITRISWTR